VAIRAVLFDLGNTLVSYYTSTQFPSVLHQCLNECRATLGWPDDPERDRELFQRALLLNKQRSDCAVRPLDPAWRHCLAFVMYTDSRP
jgi:hypothetical protein